MSRPVARRRSPSAGTHRRAAGTRSKNRRRPRLPLGSRDWFSSAIVSWFRGLVSRTATRAKGSGPFSAKHPKGRSGNRGLTPIRRPGQSRPLGYLEPLEPRQLLAVLAYDDVATVTEDAATAIEVLGNDVATSDELQIAGIAVASYDAGTADESFAVTETFAGSDTTNLPAGWVEESGDTRVFSQTIIHEGPAGNSTAAYQARYDTTSPVKPDTSYTVQFEVGTQGSGTGSGDWQVTLGTVDAGVFTPLDSMTGILTQSSSNKKFSGEDEEQHSFEFTIGAVVSGDNLSVRVERLAGGAVPWLGFDNVAVYETPINPENQGWTLTRGANPDLSGSGVGDDLGTGDNAWNVTDATGAGSQFLSYQKDLTVQQIADANANGWRLKTRARFVDDFNDGAATLFQYGNGTTRFLVFWDLDGNDDLTVWLVGTGGGTYAVTSGGTGADSYHDFEIVYNPATSKASLLVDGVAYGSDWAGAANSLAGVRWGSGSSGGEGSTNYHSVHLFVNGSVHSDAGAVLSTDRQTITYDPNGQFESLAAGETDTDTFEYTLAGDRVSSTFATRFNGDDIYNGTSYINGWANGGSTGAITETLNGTVLNLDHSGQSAASWLEGINSTTDGGTTTWNTANDADWTLETKIRFNEVSNGFAFWHGVDSDRAIFQAYADRTQDSGAQTFNVAHNNEDGEFHVFRVKHDSVANRYHVWRDGELLTGAGGVGYDSTSNDYRLILGDTSNNGTFGNGFNVDIAYIRYDQSVPVSAKASDDFESKFSGKEIWDSGFQNGWSELNGGGTTETLDGTVLHYDHAGSGVATTLNGSASTTGTGTTWNTANNGNWTLEARIRFNEVSNGFAFWQGVDTDRAIFEVYHNRTQDNGNNSFNVAHNNEDGRFHTYRVAHDSVRNMYHVWRDGVLLTGDGVPYDSTNDDTRLLFGDYTSGGFGNNFDVDIEYIRYDQTGAYAPPESDTATVTVTVTGVNDAPTATDNGYTVSEDDGNATLGNVITDNTGAGVDSDVDANDTLAVAAVNGLAADVGQTVTLASGAELKVTADGSLDYDPNGQFESLAAGETDSDTFTYTVGDHDGPRQEQASTDFDYRYEMDTAPNNQDLDGNSTDDWFDTGVPTISGGVAAGASGQLYRGDFNNSIWRALGNGDYTIEFSVQALSTGTEGSLGTFGFFAEKPLDANAGLRFNIARNSQSTSNGGTLDVNLGSNNNTDGQHVFRIAHEGPGQYWIWRDNVLLNPNGAPIIGTNNGNNNGIFGGDFSGSLNGNWELDYIRITPDAYSPAYAESTATVTVAVDGVNDAPIITDYSDGRTNHVVELNTQFTMPDLVEFTDVDLTDVHLVKIDWDYNGTTPNFTTTLTEVTDFTADTTGAAPNTPDAFSPDVTYTYTVSSGTKTALVQVDDQKGGVVQEEFTLEVLDEVIAKDDEFTTDEDTQLLGANIVTNTSPNGADEPTFETLTVTDFGGGAISGLTTITTPLGATLTIGTDGAFTYDPTTSGFLQALPSGVTVQEDFDYAIEGTLTTTLPSVGTVRTDDGVVTVFVQGLANIEIDTTLNWAPTLGAGFDPDNDGDAADTVALAFDGAGDLVVSINGNALPTDPILNARVGATTYGNIPLNGNTIEVTGSGDDDVIDYSALTSPVGITLTGLGTVDGFQGSANIPNPAGGTLLNTFDNINGLIGTNQTDTLQGPNLRTHWDIAGDNGVIVADEADLSLTGNASVIGRPTGTVPISPTTGTDEEDLSYSSFENLAGGSLDDRFDLRPDATVSGSIDGGGSGVLGQGDSLDYRDWGAGTPLTVNLATGEAHGVTGGIVMVSTTQGNEDASIENVFGGDANDRITGDTDHNILGDGLGSDVLDGGTAGDDTFRMEPGGSSDDYILDPSGSTGDTVDFRFASAGVTFDMDLLAWDEDGDVTPVTDLPDLPEQQDVFGGNFVSLVAVGEDQEAPALSPFENIVGSVYDDLIDIDPLPTVIRSVDGNDGWEPLAFDGGGSEVIDTGRLIPGSVPASFQGSLTATGIGSLNYANIEWVEPFNAQPRIVDNDDPGFGVAGNWGRSVVEGYQGDTRYALGGTGGNVATWTFSGVSPGWYRVAATWEEGANRISDAQFAVFDVADDGTKSAPKDPNGADITTIGTLNQTVAPNHFVADGAAWEEFTDTAPLYFFVSGHELQVQLSNLSSATNRRYAIADAVRIERINGADLEDDLDLSAPLPEVDVHREPEIRILAGTGGQELDAGFGVQDFGTITADATVERTYLVQNIGLFALHMTITDLDGDGFTILADDQAIADVTGAAPVMDGTEIIGYAAPLEILVGGSAIELTITMDPTDSPDAEPLTGRLFTTLSIDTDDRDEDPFDIAVTGFVETADPAAEADGTLQWVDNDNDSNPLPFDVLSGDWRYIRRDTRFLDYDYHYALGDGQTVQWTVETNVPAGTLVDVAATWAGGQNRATNATYTVRDASGVVLTKQVNQNLAPDDFENAGTMWEKLGTVKATGAELTVELTTDGANGYVVADAVWVGTSRTPTLVVSKILPGPPETLQELTNNVSVIDFGYVELNPNNPAERKINVTNVSGVPVTINLPIQMPAGFTLKETTAQLDIKDGALDDKITLDAAGDPLAIPTPFTEFTFTVQVGAQAPGPVAGTVSFYSEDAGAAPFRFGVAAQVGVQVIDNDNPGASLGGSGSAFAYLADPRFYGDDVRYHYKGTGDSYVDYEFTGLTPGQYYRVATTWVTGPSRTSYTEYKMYGGVINPNPPPFDHSQDPVVASVDQRNAPDDFYYAGEAWENLGMVQLSQDPASTTLTVRLTNKGDNWIYADAVRIEQVYLPTAEVTIGGQFYQSGQTLNFGTVLEQPGASEADSRDVTITNLGALPLQLGVPAWLNDSLHPLVNLDAANLINDNPTAWDWDDGPVTVQPGDTVTFTVSLPNAAKYYSGTLRFTTNDVTAPQFDLPVSGRVVDRWIVDESDGAASIVGNFPRVVRDTRYYNQDYRYSARGDGSDRVTWAPITGLVDGEVYTVSATWARGSSQATNAPFTITSGGNSVTVSANQRVAADDFLDGRWWETLAAIQADGTSLTVTLTDDANGYVVADAVRVDVPNTARSSPVIDWTDPDDIVKGVLLSGTQLNATETTGLPGTFVYTPGAGTELGVADDQLLTAIFTPNDPRNANAGQATVLIDVLQSNSLYLAGPEIQSDSASELSAAAASSLLPDVIAWWESQGLTAAEAARLSETEVFVAPLAGTLLGLASNDSPTIWLDTNAAGYGWNVDQRPGSEQVDLMTVLAHELGHVIGHDHDDALDVMAATLAPSTSGVWGGSGLEAATDRLPKSMPRVHAAFESLADQTSGVMSSPSTSDQPSAFRTPTSALDITDSVFARLDERAGMMTDRLFDDETPGDEDESVEEAEDGLDVWSLLYGLK